MLQVRKSRSCGISAIFVLTETQVLMTVSDFSFFSRKHFLEGVFTFQWRVDFKRAPHRGSIGVDGGRFLEKNPVPSELKWVNLFLDSSLKLYKIY